MNSTQAGDLRDRVDVYQSVAEVNDYGETVDKMERIKTIWAQVTPSSGRREEFGLMERAKVSHKIICRESAMSDIKPDTYFEVRNQRLKTEYWYPIYQRRGFMEIFCSEVIE